MSIIIDTHVLEKAVYNLCEKANCQYPADLHKKLIEKYHNTADIEFKAKLENILKNIKVAYDCRRPLCQDTGQVVVFIEIGNNICVNGDLHKIVNRAVARAYQEKHYRKSVVKNALFDRKNTNNNAPVIVYTDIVKGDEINIKLLVKGAGSENYSTINMFNPSSTKQEIFEFISKQINKAGEKACPPYVLGLGIGGTMDYACVLSKKAFFEENNSNEEIQFITELKQYLVSNGYANNILDIKLKTSSTHIACLPVALTINCHSTRHAQCTITEDTVIYSNEVVSNPDFEETSKNLKEVLTSDIDTIKSLKTGESILLTGTIYTARDAAHARLFELYSQNCSLPIDLKNKIIFYAGPCPAAPNEVIGPIGPTTSSRMDKYADFVYSNGLIATIGKGERSKQTIDTIKKYGGKYFTVQGGVACLLSKCITSSDVIAFDELGTEAIRKLSVVNLPVKVEI